MNVAYVALAPFISGAERSLQLLLKNVSACGVRPLLLCPQSSPMHRWAEENGISSVPISLDAPDSKQLFSFVHTSLRVARVLNGHQISLIHSNQIWSIPAVNRMRRILRLKLISHLRDPVGVDAKWWLKGGIDGAICVSKYIEQELVKNVPSSLFGKGTTIINPVEFPEDYSLENSKARRVLKKKKFGLEPTSFVFAFVGQIAPVKGVDALILAFARLNLPGACLVIAGSSPPAHRLYEEECTGLVRDMGLTSRVRMVGFQDDISDVYEACDVVVVPSIAEPLGRVPLEAACYYRPVIATEVGGLPEVVKHGQTGWLVPLGDNGALVEAMRSSVTSRLDSLGAQARTWALDIADPKLHARQVVSFYDQILG